MKKQLSIWMMIIVMACLFVGCGNKKTEEALFELLENRLLENRLSENTAEISPEKELCGQWKHVEGDTKFSTIEFFDDGTYTSSHPNLKGNFSITDNRIKLEGYLVEDVVETFEVVGDELHFLYDSGGIKCTFIKQ